MQCRPEFFGDAQLSGHRLLLTAVTVGRIINPPEYGRLEAPAPVKLGLKVHSGGQRVGLFATQSCPLISEIAGQASGGADRWATQKTSRPCPIICQPINGKFANNDAPCKWVQPRRLIIWKEAACDWYVAREDYVSCIGAASLTGAGVLPMPPPPLRWPTRRNLIRFSSIFS